MLHSNGLGRRLGCFALVMEAVTASGCPVQVAVGTQRRRPFNLAQDSAVRLMLMPRALAPVRTPVRGSAPPLAVS